MSTFRKPLTCLLLLGLLVGNLGGILHIGCVTSSDTVPEGCAEIVETAQRGCCFHHQRSSDCGGDQAGNPRTRDQGIPPAEHDSDACSICQTFLSLRHALPQLQLPQLVGLLTIGLQPIPDQAPLPDALFLGAVFLRGPPLG